MTNAESHAEMLDALPCDTRAIVLDALKVRAMDFVADRINAEGGDEAADIYRAYVRRIKPGDPDDAMPFDPNRYRPDNFDLPVF